MKTREDLQSLVDRVLRNAVDNGCDEVLFDAPQRVAVDLGTCCPDLEGMEVDVLAPLVKSWQERNVVEQ